MILFTKMLHILIHPWTEVCPRPGKCQFFYPFLLIFAAFERSRSPNEQLCRRFFVGTPWYPPGSKKHGFCVHIFRTVNFSSISSFFLRFFCMRTPPRISHKRNIALSISERTEIAKQHKSGVSITQLHKEFGRGRRTIRKFINLSKTR